MRAICDRLPFSDLPQPGLGRVAAADLVQRIMILLQKVKGHDVVAGRMIQIGNAGDLLEVLHASVLELSGNVDRGNSRPDPGPALASNQLAGRQSFGGLAHAHFLAAQEVPLEDLAPYILPAVIEETTFFTDDKRVQLGIQIADRLGKPVPHILRDDKLVRVFKPDRKSTRLNSS